ncbi:MAG TPA: MASE1 domain-containing protein [Burkholderiales bacterium]|nr:MASE1 domain-containing protein [Burkholderiales bacterium]
MQNPARWRQAGLIILLAAVYFAAAKVSLLVAIPPGYASAIWPPSGIALGALLLGNRRLWPGVWIGSFAANLSIEGALLASLVIATGSGLQAFAVATLVRRLLGVPRRFERVQEVLRFVGLTVGGAIIAPTVALLPLATIYPLAAADLVSNWWTWWQGDACGMLIFTPLILSWSAPGTVSWTPRRMLEAVAFTALLLVTTEIVFSAGFGRSFVLLPFIVWAAFRFGQREVTTASTLLCGMALWYTLSAQVGPFASLPLNESLLLLLVFVSTVVVTGLMLCAVLSQLRAAMEALRGRQVRTERTLSEREAELVRAKEAAEKASEAKSQFLANMSHELRTPLNSLLILAKLLADNGGGNLTAKQVQFAKTIHDSGIDLLVLINDLLDLAKIESGAAATMLNLSAARIDDLRDELERGFRALAQQRGLQFAIVLEPGVPASLRTDATRLKQILKNLLANAFKFTQRGGVRLVVSPAAPGSIAFSVVDTGIGIPADKLELIFEAFRQADGSTSRQYGGTGLGLSISRGLAQLLGGELKVTSTPGQGSTFTLVLPAS